MAEYYPLRTLRTEKETEKARKIGNPTKCENSINNTAKGKKQPTEPFHVSGGPDALLGLLRGRHALARAGDWSRCGVTSRLREPRQTRAAAMFSPATAAAASTPRILLPLLLHCSCSGHRLRPVLAPRCLDRPGTDSLAKRVRERRVREECLLPCWCRHFFLPSCFSSFYFFLCTVSFFLLFAPMKKMWRSVARGSSRPLYIIAGTGFPCIVQEQSRRECV